jgi:hypothetical protein
MLRRPKSNGFVGAHLRVRPHSGRTTRYAPPTSTHEPTFTRPPDYPIVCPSKRGWRNSRLYSIHDLTRYEMKKIILISIIVLSAVHFGFAQDKSVSIHTLVETRHNSDKILESAFKNRKDNLQVEGQGIVIKILPDDLAGTRHQRFIVRLSSGQTLLIAHNIDLAPRIISLRKGDQVFFYGVYEWNSKGGTIHWTHHDPEGRHIAGWIKHHGKKYQ